MLLFAACRGDQLSAMLLEPVPSWALAECRSASALRAVCPQALPPAPWSELSRGAGKVSLCLSGDPDCPRWDSFDLAWGGESPGHPERNRPDGSSGLVHVVAYAGDLGGPVGYQAHGESAFSFDWPAVAIPLRDGLMEGERGEALLLETPAGWGREGQLVLAPAYALGGLVGDHLVFRWEEDGIEYAIGLHAWEPLTEAAATLRDVLRSSEA